MDAGHHRPLTDESLVENLHIDKGRVAARRGLCFNSLESLSTPTGSSRLYSRRATFPALKWRPRGQSRSTSLDRGPSIDANRRGRRSSPAERQAGRIIAEMRAQAGSECDFRRSRDWASSERCESLRSEWQRFACDCRIRGRLRY